MPSIHDVKQGSQDTQLSSGNVRIAPKDVPAIVAASKAFAAVQGFRFRATVDQAGFKLQMNKGQMAIHAHNLDCADLIKALIFDQSGRNDGNVLLAQEYMDLLYNQSSVPQFGP